MLFTREDLEKFKEKYLKPIDVDEQYEKLGETAKDCKISDLSNLSNIIKDNDTKIAIYILEFVRLYDYKYGYDEVASTFVSCLMNDKCREEINNNFLANKNCSWFDYFDTISDYQEHFIKSFRALGKILKDKSKINSFDRVNEINNMAILAIKHEYTPENRKMMNL